MIILATAWLLYATGMYRATLRHGLKPDLTCYEKIKAHVMVIGMSLIWPYTVGYNLTKPRVTMIW